MNEWVYAAVEVTVEEGCLRWGKVGLGGVNMSTSSMKRIVCGGFGGSRGERWFRNENEYKGRVVRKSV